MHNQKPCINVNITYSPHNRDSKKTSSKRSIKYKKKNGRTITAVIKIKLSKIVNINMYRRQSTIDLSQITWWGNKMIGAR